MGVITEERTEVLWIRQHFQEYLRYIRVGFHLSEYGRQWLQACNIIGSV